jgi:hypothetical protein
MSNAAQRLGPPSGAGWTCKLCGTRNRVDDVACRKCHKLAPLVAEALTREGKAEHSNAVDLHSGQRSWEGEHRVVLVSRDLPMNAELLIDGKSIQNAKRIEIDVDSAKSVVIVKIEQIEMHEQIDGSTALHERTIELTANLLNITLEEARVVDVILNKARQEASSNAQAVQLFTITDTDEQGEQTTQILGDLLRDANRYRALRALIAEENDAIDLHTAQVRNHKPYDADGLDQVADELWTSQAEQRRIERQAQS